MAHEHPFVFGQCTPLGGESHRGRRSRRHRGAACPFDRRGAGFVTNVQEGPASSSAYAVTRRDALPFPDHAASSAAESAASAGRTWSVSCRCAREPLAFAVEFFHTAGEQLWRARHDTLYAALAIRPGARAWISDVCVPISRLAECIIETKQDTAGAPFPISLVGHAGDGNFHLLFILDVNNPAELDVSREINDRLVLRALRWAAPAPGNTASASAR